ncbi:TVP38/TMEM64 family protein [Pseudanabaena sp. FACHB-2040]|uniref:TVP38/TMEM64 family protein n=1 Tax=Pseudanabaena sp. FACHB-2040 TaxID=2692859 RepID=UPI0016858591|nr:TVP38/TMEM64 family protein [Pseudanabaena sp. FACHB-2040]MBD2257992.1 TVP38/TMEM64 family protein [Pseudanabaena sp. FACHB-2040]
MKFSWLRSRRFWLLVLVGVLIAVIGSRLPLAEWFVAVNSGLASLGSWALPAFILVYLIATILGLPNVLLILVAGSLFGLVQGAIAASIADTLGAIACFFIGRTVARKRIKRWMEKHPKFAQIDQAVERKGWKILLLTRLSPLVPSSVLNYGFSCTQVNFWQYAFFSWIGMIPVILLYAYLGSFGTYLLNSEITVEKIAIQVVGLVLALGAALYVTRLTRRAIIPQCPECPEEKPAEAVKTKKP